MSLLGFVSIFFNFYFANEKEMNIIHVLITVVTVTVMCNDVDKQKVELAVSTTLVSIMMTLKEISRIT